MTAKYKTYYETLQSYNSLTQFASIEIVVIFNGKSFTILDHFNFDFNEFYEDFTMNLDMILITKVKQSLKVIQAADKKIRWK